MSTVRRESGQNLPTEYSEMQTVASIAAFSRSLIRREQYRAGGDAERAIARVASRLKTGRGTLANIIRSRVKSVCFALGQRIIAAAISDIENERKQLEHERKLLMELGSNPNPDDLRTVEDALETARAALLRMRSAA